MKSKETKKLMDEFNEDFSDMEGLFDTTLPDPTMVEFYRRLKNREILWNDDIAVSYTHLTLPTKA